MGLLRRGGFRGRVYPIGSVTDGVADDEALRGGRFGVPAGAGDAGSVAAGVPSQARDDHVDVFLVGVDRDPLAGAGFAPGQEGAGDERRFEQAGAVQRVGDRTGAVVPRFLPGFVTAAPDVGGEADVVGGGDQALDRGRRGGRGDRLFAAHRGEGAGDGRGGDDGGDAARRGEAGDFGFRGGGGDRRRFDRFARVGRGDAARFGARRGGEDEQGEDGERDEGG